MLNDPFAAAVTPPAGVRREGVVIPPGVDQAPSPLVPTPGDDATVGVEPARAACSSIRRLSGVRLEADGIDMLRVARIRSVLPVVSVSGTHGEVSYER